MTDTSPKRQGHQDEHSVGTQNKPDSEDLIRRLNHALRLLNISHDAILCVDNHCQITLINPGGEDLFGYPANALLGKPATVLLCPEFHSREHHRLKVLTRIARESRLGFRGEQIIAMRSSGERFPCELSVSRSIADDRIMYTLVARDVSRQVDQTRQLNHDARHDHLTDLPNRLLLAERLNSGIAHADRNGRKLGVVYLDLNRFKPINDHLGHEAGDCLLQAVARRLSDAMRRTDTVSRIGGDEFIICLEQIKGLQDAVAASHKIVHAFREPFQVMGRSLSITASIGVAIYPDHGRDANTLLRHADQAMDSAKTGGRNRPPRST